MKKSLYNIEEEYLKIANQLEDGELSPELETALAINEAELQGKAVAYIYVVKTEESDVVAIDAELKRLTALKRAKKNKIEWLKNTVHKAMDLYGINEIKTETLKINFRKSEGVICTDSEVSIDKDLCTVVPETSKPNLTAIKKAIKAGVDVKGFEIEERYSLQIK
jgi:hypothetical protein